MDANPSLSEKGGEGSAFLSRIYKGTGTDMLKRWSEPFILRISFFQYTHIPSDKMHRMTWLVTSTDHYVNA